MIWGFSLVTLQLPECSCKIDGKFGLKWLGFHQDCGVLCVYYDGV